MRYGPIHLKSENGEGLITLDIYEEEDRLVCGIYRLEAKMKSPKKLLTTMREEMHKLEQIARDAGCVEMRVAGRDWSRVFTDYEYLMGVPNGLRKAL